VSWLEDHSPPSRIEINTARSDTSSTRAHGVWCLMKHKKSLGFAVRGMQTSERSSTHDVAVSVKFVKNKEKEQLRTLK
jgi:hypothetical protein